MGNCMRNQKAEDDRIAQQTLFVPTEDSKRFASWVQPISKEAENLPLINQEVNAESSFIYPDTLALQSRIQRLTHPEHHPTAPALKDVRRSQGNQNDFKAPLSNASLVNRSSSNLNQSQSEGDCKFTCQENLLKGKENNQILSKENSKQAHKTLQIVDSLGSVSEPSQIRQKVDMLRPEPLTKSQNMKHH